MLRQLILTLVASCGLVSASKAELPLLEVTHKASVLSVALSPDGKILASGCASGTIILTDVTSRLELRRIETQSPVVGLAFSPDAQLLGVKTETGSYSIYSVSDGTRGKTLGMTGYKATCLAFTMDGTTLVGAGVGEQVTWHHSRGGGSASRTANRSAGAFAAISADGSTTGWGQPSGLLQLQLGGTQPDSSRQIRHLKVGAAQCMAFGPNGGTVLSGNADKLIRMWNLGGQELRKFEGLNEPATRVAISQNGKILVAAGTSDPVLRVWDVPSARLRRQVVTHLAGVKALALTSDGRSLITAAGDKAQVWNIATRDLGALGPPVMLSKTELDRLWTELASTDFVTADNAFKKLATGGKDAISFLQDQILHVAMPAVDWKQVDQWIDELDAEAYPVRQKAMAELAKLGELAEVPLKKVLAARPSLEATNRATKLLARLKEPDLSPDRLRALQALDLLETLGTAESRQALSEVGREALIARIRQEASEALQRLSK